MGYNDKIITGVITLRRRCPIPTLLIAVLVPKMQRIFIVHDAHTETDKVLSSCLLVTQQSTKTIAITRGMGTYESSVTSVYVLGEIVN